MIKMQVEYLPVYNPVEIEQKNANLYAENVRKKMADSLGVPCSELTYENGVLYELSLKLKLPTCLGKDKTMPSCRLNRALNLILKFPNSI